MSELKNEQEVLLQEETVETTAEKHEVSDEVLLKVENLCQYFKLGQSTLKAVNNVSFDIKKGEVFGLVGESGCGKTTTGRSIIKLYDCTSGNVYFGDRRICAGTKAYKDTKKAAFNAMVEALKAKGEEKPDFKAELNKYLAVAKEENVKIRAAKHDHKKCDKEYAKEHVASVKDEYLPKLKEMDKKSPEYKETLKNFLKEYRLARKERLVTKIQMVFQDPIASLDPRMTVKEIIAEGLIIKGIRDKKVIEEKVYEVLEKVGLVREHAGRYPHEFSGGQRQRIGVARSIIMRPELIIADEPVSALDVSIQAQVINLLNELRHELGLTILFIAHDLSVVKYFSDRIAVMYFGNMVELTTSEELFKNPLHPYTKSLLSAIPLPDPIYEKKRTRIVYNPLADHDYSVDKPEFREVAPGHFVSCNEAEFKKYQEILANNK
ncbi:MAG: ATP-binding cassette domain-containing protein [Clostridia bacterium]|nr:ATP-binding cassette domain-containing protein [Clostridia bacterium]